MRYVVKRLLQAFLTIYVVISLSFVMIREMPGGPLDYIGAQLLQGGGGTEQLEALAETVLNINPNRPLHEQYISYMTATLQGDLGQSVWYEEPVAAILGRALPWTVMVMSIALVLTFSFAVLLGAMMAYRQGSWFDGVVSVFGTAVDSVPYYIAAVLLLYVASFQLSIFPTGGRMSRGMEPNLSIAFFADVLYHATLPIASIALTGWGIKSLQMRGNSIQTLGSDYLRVAKLRGLADWRITIGYVAHNAVLPMYTGFVISIGFVFGGSIILEEIFSYPGLGYYLFQAINARDYPLMMGGFIVITIAVVTGLFVADLTYSRIDPRIGTGGQRR